MYKFKKAPPYRRGLIITNGPNSQDMSICQITMHTFKPYTSAQLLSGNPVSRRYQTMMISYVRPFLTSGPFLYQTIKFLVRIPTSVAADFSESMAACHDGNDFRDMSLTMGGEEGLTS